MCPRKKNRKQQRKKKQKEDALASLYNTTWQFQLEPVSEMDFDAFMAMNAYYADQPHGKQLSPQEAFLDVVSTNDMKKEDDYYIPF